MTRAHLALGLSIASLGVFAFACGGSGVGGSGGSTGGGGAGGAAAGTTGGAAGARGAAGTGGMGGTGGMAATGGLGGGLCSMFTLDSGTVTPTVINDGSSVDVGSFTGGTLVSGTYWLTAVTHYGSTPYDGATQEIVIIDASAPTLRLGDARAVGTEFYNFSLIPVAGSPNLIEGMSLCSGSFATEWYYTVGSAGATLTLNNVGSNDVGVLTRQ